MKRSGAAREAHWCVRVRLMISENFLHRHSFINCAFCLVLNPLVVDTRKSTPEANKLRKTKHKQEGNQKYRNMQNLKENWECFVGNNFSRTWNPGTILITIKIFVTWPSRCQLIWWLVILAVKMYNINYININYININICWVINFDSTFVAFTPILCQTVCLCGVDSGMHLSHFYWPLYFPTQNCTKLMIFWIIKMLQSFILQTN